MMNFIFSLNFWQDDFDKIDHILENVVRIIHKRMTHRKKRGALDSLKKVVVQSKGVGEEGLGKTDIHTSFGSSKSWGFGLHIWQQGWIHYKLGHHHKIKVLMGW